MDLRRWAGDAIDLVGDWMSAHGQVSEHESVRVDDDRFAAAFADFGDRLQNNPPFFHPGYAGHMMRPPHPAAAIGYLAAMLINPNNHAVDGGPATTQMEHEVVAQLADMFGFPDHLGHLTSSGTIANLEALFVARESHPGLGIAFSEDAHFTHSRMCHLLGVTSYPVAVDDKGRLDVEDLERLLRTGRVGTVVATAGSTGLGAVDPIHDLVTLKERHGVRIHVDAAYGGFFALLAGTDGPHGLPPEPWRAIERCDSVVVDPHKHGLQPYGCGAVLFRDPAVGRFYRHDAPYTYCAPSEQHLGEISLECSRAGAAAAAFWLTLKVLPATPAGLGAVLAACRRSALDLAESIEASGSYQLFQQPDLDIVTYFPVAEPQTMSGIDARTAAVVAAGELGPEPVYLSTLKVKPQAFAQRHIDIGRDTERARIIRSVLMKPEFEHNTDELYRRLDRLAKAV